MTCSSFLVSGRRSSAVGSYEFGKSTRNQRQRVPNDVAAGLLAETALGPFFIGGSVGDPATGSGFSNWGACSKLAIPGGGSVSDWVSYRVNQKFRLPVVSTVGQIAPLRQLDEVS